MFGLLAVVHWSLFSKCCLFVSRLVVIFALVECWKLNSVVVTDVHLFFSNQAFSFRGLIGMLVVCAYSCEFVCGLFFRLYYGFLCEFACVFSCGCLANSLAKCL